jgi:hypothetical protein
VREGYFGITMLHRTTLRMQGMDRQRFIGHFKGDFSWGSSSVGEVFFTEISLASSWSSVRPRDEEAVTLYVEMTPIITVYYEE